MNKSQNQTVYSALFTAIRGNQREYSSKPLKHSISQGRIHDFFLGAGALVSCSISTPINHIDFFFTEYQLY